MRDLNIRSNRVADLNTKFGQLSDTLLQTAAIDVVEATSPSTAGASFSVPHSLGRTPTFAMGASETGQAIGIADADYKLWTERNIVVRSATASTKYRILIAAVNV